MEKHPIEDLMTTIMTNLKSMVDVNTIIGQSIVAGNNIIIPVSKVVFGFAAGGSEFNTETIQDYSKNNQDEEISYTLPFGGGSGAGIDIKPIAFLLIDAVGNTKVIHLDNNNALEKAIEYIPELSNKIIDLVNNKKTM